MKISEEQLKALVLRVLQELEAEKSKCGARQKVYMLCSATWSPQYTDFLRETDASGAYDVYPVVPVSWEKQGYETALKSYRSCCSVLYRSGQHPADLEQAITVFPVVPRDVLVKTALCIGDTFETAWIMACMEAGSRIVFLRSGLAKFSGKEPPAYVNRIMEYCRQALEYGIAIGGMEALPGDGKELTAAPPRVENQGKRRVITASNVDQLASNGVLFLHPGDIVTDLARDRAKFLNIVLR